MFLPSPTLLSFPNTADPIEEAIMNMTPELQEELKSLSYFKDIRDRRAWMARMTVLLAVVGLLMLNVYLLYLSTNTVILNGDLVRLEQSDQFDLTVRRLEHLQMQVRSLQAATAAAEQTPATR